jgi:hypothetical protein
MVRSRMRSPESGSPESGSPESGSPEYGSAANSSVIGDEAVEEAANGVCLVVEEFAWSAHRAERHPMDRTELDQLVLGPFDHERQHVGQQFVIVLTPNDGVDESLIGGDAVAEQSEERGGLAFEAAHACETVCAAIHAPDGANAVARTGDGGLQCVLALGGVQLGHGRSALL